MGPKQEETVKEKSDATKVIKGAWHKGDVVGMQVCNE